MKLSKNFPGHSLKGRVLVIAGSDSGGCAGIQADIKTINSLGGYSATAITALTAQNTQGVFGISEVPVKFIQQQIELVLSDIGADAIKTGMLYSAEIVENVAKSLKNYSNIPLIVDPVMVATSGDSLAEGDEFAEALKKFIIPNASLVTPNIPEAEKITGIRINNINDSVEAGRAILDMGAAAVLVKGGHAICDIVEDILVMPNGEFISYKSERIRTANIHGTGCTLASAISCGISQGMSLDESIKRARNYVWNAIKTAPGLGKGRGPLNHINS